MNRYQIEKEVARERGERRISGRDLKRIREKCGYSAREFAELLRAMRARITTTRSVYRLEERLHVEFRYVDALIKLVGKLRFEQSVSEIVREEAERERWREEMQRRREEEDAERERERQRQREAACRVVA